MSDISDLTTLEDVKAWIDPTPIDTPESDALLERLITAVSNAIHRYLNRYIPATEYEEIRNGTGGHTLVFSNFPVTAVTTVTVGTINIPPAPNRGVFASGYLFTPTKITLRGFRFYRAEQNVVLRYNAGYSTIPTALSQAANELVSLRYRQRSREGLTQETVVGVASETFANVDFTESIRSVLDPFRNVVPTGGAGSFVLDPIF